MAVRRMSPLRYRLTLAAELVVFLGIVALVVLVMGTAQ
jgi:hypothetical protein